MIKRLITILVITLGIGGTGTAAAPAPIALKIAPLQYQESIPLGTKKSGHVDVSNPTTSTLTLRSSVEAFQQIDNDGNLAFSPSEALRAGITTDVSEFELGPREAIRVAFTIDPNKLPRGGVYGALFFTTMPAKSGGSGAQVAALARVGTLFILDIGGGGTKDGRVSRMHLPFVALGNGIAGKVEYENTASGSQPIAFNPKLQLKTGFFGKPARVRGPLVLPQNSRVIQVDRKGSFLGIVPVKVIDSTTSPSKSKTAYVFAVTGYWRFVLAMLLIMIATYFYWLRKGKKRHKK